MLWLMLENLEKENQGSSMRAPVTIQKTNAANTIEERLLLLSMSTPFISLPPLLIC